MIELDYDNILPDPPERWALVVGNSHYAHAPMLTNPGNDAAAMRDVLTELGFQVVLAVDIDGRELKKVIDEFGQASADSSIRLFYYAGHAIQFQGTNYLVPVEANLTTEVQVEYDCVEVDRVLAYFRDKVGGVNIIFLDACRDDPFSRRWRGGGPRGLAAVAAPIGTLIGYATAPGQIASDGDGQNGTYTEALLKHLATPDIDLLRALQRVRVDVTNKTSGSQVPWDSTSLTGDVTLLDEVCQAFRLIRKHPEVRGALAVCQDTDQTLADVQPEEIFLNEVSTEGGSVCIFRSEDKVRRLEYTECWESGRATDVWYLRENKPVFAASEVRRYNVPFYVDEDMAESIGSTEVFDEEKTEVTRIYRWFADCTLSAIRTDDVLRIPDQDAVEHAKDMYETLLARARPPIW